MTAYYSEHDKFAAAWLRELIKSGLIADGEVDERDIQQVEPGDLRGFTQCHFFAGIGVWSYALRSAGWSDDTPVWTGSCPCQGFSTSGKREGFSDQRHLWPAWFGLIRECAPVTIFGEQVASPDGLAWFDIVSSDMEGADYTIGACDTCAAGFGAPHIRQRLYFVADSNNTRSQGRIIGRNCSNERIIGESSVVSRLGVSNGNGSHPRNETTSPVGQRNTTHAASFWVNAAWIKCIDGKHRPVESGTFPLATGIKNRVGKLRGYGNALCAPQAQGFIEAYLALLTGE